MLQQLKTYLIWIPHMTKSSVPWPRRAGAESTGDFLLPDPPERLSRPILAVEPTLEVAVLTRWLAQSNFATARA